MELNLICFIVGNWKLQDLRRYGKDELGTLEESELCSHAYELLLCATRTAGIAPQCRAEDAGAIAVLATEPCRGPARVDCMLQLA